jgi:D-alanine-D-alanine ligase
MKIAVVHNQVASQDSADARDVLVQADAISKALTALSHPHCTLPCNLDLDAIRKKLQGERPDLVFNLVEDLGGHGRLIHLFPSLLDALKIPYTGSPAESIFLSSHKTLAKELLRQNDLPTPAWQGGNPHLKATEDSPALAKPTRWIIKSLWEHASLGLSADSLITTDSRQVLAAEIARRGPALGGNCFAEEFIEGREFNLSLLDSENGPQVLPPAEILFQDYTPDMIRIVDYQAKWEEGSFGYRNTVRSFDFAPEDANLLNALKTLAQQCWQVFGLKGYARVDFRVDPNGRPFILEVNANPCLSPDAGYAAALQRAGLGFEEAMDRIITSAPPASGEDRRPTQPGSL